MGSIGSQIPPGINPTNFQRWRPRYHIQAASNWMNDPCAPFYNESTQTYHVYFQYNPLKNSWGSISWAEATSADLVNWKVRTKPILRPDEPYDKDGIFTGTAFPQQKDGRITIAYTAVSQLPIHYTLPYNIGSEKLALATSNDSGQTWTKHPSNPILSTPPQGIEVAALRDPYIAHWPAMSDLLNHNPQDWLYGIVSGSIRDKTPTMFLYKINAKDYTEWSYISPLVDLALNFSPSKWVGDYGANWEVANFLPLFDGKGRRMEVLIMGAEGITSRAFSSEPGLLSRPLTRWRHQMPDKLVGPSRTARAQKWLAGPLRLTDNNEPRVELATGGTLDHGCFYAANSFRDPKSEDSIVWGWLTEDDLPDELRQQQGWSGCLSLPRRLYIQTLKKVVRSRNSSLEAIGTFLSRKNENADGTYEIHTLGISPIKELQEMRSGARYLSLPYKAFLGTEPCPALPISTVFFELTASIRLTPACPFVGLHIYYDALSLTWITISFHPVAETITIDRTNAPQPSGPHRVSNRPETAPHTLFTCKTEDGFEEREETLDIRIFHDASVVELFVNERTVVSTRVYAQECYGVRFFAGGNEVGEGGGGAFLEDAQAWDGLSTRMTYVNLN